MLFPKGICEPANRFGRRLGPIISTTPVFARPSRELVTSMREDAEATTVMKPKTICEFELSTIGRVIDRRAKEVLTCMGPSTSTDDAFKGVSMNAYTAVAFLEGSIGSGMAVLL